MNEILARVKQLSIEKKALLTAAEFDAIAAAILHPSHAAV